MQPTSDAHVLRGSARNTWSPSTKHSHSTRPRIASSSAAWQISHRSSGTSGSLRMGQLELSSRARATSVGLATRPARGNPRRCSSNRPEESLCRSTRRLSCSHRAASVRTACQSRSKPMQRACTDPIAETGTRVLRCRVDGSAAGGKHVRMRLGLSAYIEAASMAETKWPAVA